MEIEVAYYIFQFIRQYLFWERKSSPWPLHYNEKGQVIFPIYGGHMNGSWSVHFGRC